MFSGNVHQTVKSAKGNGERPNLQCPCAGYHQICPFEGSPRSSSHPLLLGGTPLIYDGKLSRNSERSVPSIGQ